jgi:lipopolysaccharide export system protein LptA
VNWAQSQAPIGTAIENFRVSEKSLDNQRSTLLTGETALFLEGGIMSLSKPRLVTVTSEGKTSLVFNASECLYNQETKTISSPGQMSLSTADGQMQLSGLGFSGSLVGPTLTISTNVQAKLKKSLRDVSFRNIPGRVAGEGGDIINISAREFEMMPGKAEFRNSVIVKDVEGDLRADVIKIVMQNEDGLIESIKAFGGIEVKSEKISITNEHVDSRASYDLESGSILIKGSPSWRMGERSGRADSIMVNRESMIISANGNVEMKVPSSGKESDLFQFNPTLNSEGDSKSLSLNISSGYFVFEPARKEKKGYARYIGSVQLKRGDTRLDCQYLNFIMSAGSNEEKLEAARATGVSLYQGDDRLNSNVFFYDFEQGRMLMEVNPNWNLGGQSGEARKVEINTKSGKFFAQGDVEMKLAKARGVAGLLFPLNKRKASSGDGSSISVNCEFFEYIRSLDSSHVDSVKFYGGVSLAGKNGFNLKANSIDMEIDSIKKDLNSIHAIGELSGSTIGQNPMRFNGGQLNYERNSNVVRLKGDPNVEIYTEQDGSQVVAFGSEAHYKTGEGRLSLLGNPLLKTPEGVLRGEKVVYDQKDKRLRASGNWKMTLNAESIRQIRNKSE